MTLREYLYKYTDEQHSVSTQELIDEMAHQGYPGNRKTIKDDIDVHNKLGMDIITNVSRGNSFYMGAREFEIPELKFLVDAVSLSRFISVARSEQLIGKLSAMVSAFPLPENRLHEQYRIDYNIKRIVKWR